MKKATVGLIGILLVIMLKGNAWAHSQSGLRANLTGNGFGFSISDGHSSVSAFLYNNYPPYYPHNYSRHNPSRPYLRWGSYRRHHNHNYWGHHRSGRHYKNHIYGHQRGYKRGSHGKHYRNHHRNGHHGRRLRW